MSEALFVAFPGTILLPLHVCMHFLPASLLLPLPVSRELSQAAWTAPVRQMEMDPGLCGDSCVPDSPLWPCTC